MNLWIFTHGDGDGLCAGALAFVAHPEAHVFFTHPYRSIDKEELLIVQSLYPPQASHLIELLPMIHTARGLRARSVKAFVPYLAYSRQGKRYLDGEYLSSVMIAEMLQNLD